MELQDAIANRRSSKIFKRDMHIDDEALYQAIKQSSDAPNHGLREPWRVVHIAKDRLGDMSKAISDKAFPHQKDKQQDHYKTVTKLGGMLALIVKDDPRQKENLENYLAFGTFAQNLMLLLHEAHIGTCWKTPPYIFMPQVRKELGVKDDESLVGFLYLTDMQDDMSHAPRHTHNIITEF